MPRFVLDRSWPMSFLVLVWLVVVVFAPAPALADSPEPTAAGFPASATFEGSSVVRRPRGLPAKRRPSTPVMRAATLPGQPLDPHSFLSGADAAPPAPAPDPDGVEQEKVIGTNDLEAVANVTSFPWSAVTKLYMTFGPGESYGCSGAMIAPDLVLTAAHCLWDNGLGGIVTAVTAVPGKYGDYEPFGAAYGAEAWIPTAYKQSEDQQHDFAVLRLTAPIGQQSGSFEIQNEDDGFYANLPTLNIAGYPGALSSGEVQYFDSSTVHSHDDNQVTYLMDSLGGMSGGPVWRYDADGNRRRLVIVHAWSSSVYAYNGGTRLNDEHIALIAQALASSTYCVNSGACACAPTCDGDVCGSNGCGGSCGTCGGGAACFEGQCVPAGWTCDPGYFGAKDGCDCGCGAWDPDCGDASSALFGCGDGESCNNVGHCVPQNWGCEADFYGVDDGCDCGCGAWDPDCDAADAVQYGCAGNEVCVEPGACACVPDCDGRACGPDGCGGTCGGCDDDDACTVDACSGAGQCTSTALSCDDGDPCTHDTCDPASGCVATAVVCNDDDACTHDSCVPMVGCLAAPVGCDDGDPCTSDGCDTETGCSVTPVDCDDGDACTIDRCDPTVGCVADAISCDDGDPCTLDGCDPGAGCRSVPVACGDGAFCSPSSGQCENISPPAPAESAFGPMGCQGSSGSNGAWIWLAVFGLLSLLRRRRLTG